MDDPSKRHYAVIDKYPRKITVKHKEKILLETKNALILKEIGKSVYNPVLYFSKEDLLSPIIPDLAKQSHCPIKGDATYWNFPNIPVDDYFAWSYEKPLGRSKKIEGFIAFNPDHVTYISEPI